MRVLSLMRDAAKTAPPPEASELRVSPVARASTVDSGGIVSLRSTRPYPGRPYRLIIIGQWWVAPQRSFPPSDMSPRGQPHSPIPADLARRAAARETPHSQNGKSKIWSGGAAVLCGRMRFHARGAPERELSPKASVRASRRRAMRAQCKLTPGCGRRPTIRRHLLRDARLVKSKRAHASAASGAPTVHRPAPAEPRAPRGPYAE